MPEQKGEIGYPEDIDGFGVLEHLGSGSFAETFRVKAQDGSEYALKWLRAGVSADERGRFENEIWALGVLDHNSIPKLIHTGIYQGRPYLVETLARGRSLRKQSKRQIAEHGTAPVVQVLTILREVLDGLSYMHSRGILHRDVKDDNVVATPSDNHVFLIDFGYCKGPGQPNDVASVWNVGAARYGPPSKLEHPASADPSHDVFAVGVLGYLLLTNRYPWEMSTSEDHGDLRKRMLAVPPEPIARLNPNVNSRVTGFFHRLLNLEDHLRPTAEMAKADCENLLVELTSEIASPAVGSAQLIQLSRVMRDPLHGDIRMTEFEWRVLGSKEVQRLRWMRQLGFVNLVYPGAEHSRLSHSLGTMYLADRILRSIEDRTGNPIDLEDRLIARLYALIHDVTHIAYGHTLEDELEVFGRHDLNESRIDRLLFSNSSELGAVLRSTKYGRDTLALFDLGSSVQRNNHIKDLIEGATGSDVLDYIDRDSYFCGLDHRVDSAIFRRYSVVPTSRTIFGGVQLASRIFGSHGVRLDAEFAIESLFLERYALFLKVYTHPAKTAAGAMLGKAILETEGGKNSEFSEEKLEWMGDEILLGRLASSKRAGPKRIAEQILNRRLYKPAFRAQVLDPNQRHQNEFTMREASYQGKGLFDPRARSAIEEQLARSAGLDPLDVVVYCSRPPGLQKVRQYVESKPGDTVLRDELFKPYLNTYELHLGLWTVYVFSSARSDTSEFDALGEASEGVFGLENQAQMSRRQGVLF